jgi:hypothetical protein
MGGLTAATAQLAARGIVVTAAPAVQEAGAGQARAEGGGVVVRYTVTDQLGGDEEVVLAEARSRSTLRLAEPAPAQPLPLPAPSPGQGSAAPSTQASAAAPLPMVVAPAGSVVSAPPGSLAGGAAASGVPLPAGGGDAAAPAGIGATAPGMAAPLTPVHPALNLLGREDDRALRRLRAGYRVIILLAAAGAALHFAAQRSHTA